MNFRLSERIDAVKPSILREASKIFSADTILFAGGCPENSCYPKEELGRISKEILMSDDGVEALEYNDSHGYTPLRKNICKIMKNRAVNTSVDNILMINGSQQGIDFVGRILLDKGNAIIVENPTYVGALNTFRNYQVNFIGVDMDEDGMLMDDLEDKLKKNDNIKLIYTIPNFQNPTGTVWSLQRRKELVELANKYNVIIVEDDPYGELRYEGEAISCCKSFDKEGRVIYLGSFSKVLSPGLRIGWICTDKELREKILICKQTVDMHTCALTQRIVSKYLDEIDFEKRLSGLREVYGIKRNCMLQALEKHMPKEVKYTKSTGGFFIWLELPKYISTTQMLKKSIKDNVAYMPGTMFFSDNNSDNDNYLRLSFSQMSLEIIEEGIKILADVINGEIEKSLISQVV